MAKNNNLGDFLTDIANAIREKEGTTDTINAQEFSDRIKALTGSIDVPEGYEPFLAVDEGYFVQGESDGFKSKYTGEQIDALLDAVGQGGGGGGDTPSRPKWTGHADAEGLRAIGWTDEDITYYQEHGVNWNEEDDEYHKVSEDNKALYGVLTADNISTYKDRIVYLPKIDTSGLTTMSQMFQNFYTLVAIPMLDTSSVTSMNNMFYGCSSLTCIPLLDTSNVKNMGYMFRSCSQLTYVPLLDTSKVTNMGSVFYGCSVLESIPLLDTGSATSMISMFYSCPALREVPLLNTQNVTNMNSMFRGCSALVSIPALDTQKVTNMTSFVHNCYSLVSIELLDAIKMTTVTSMFTNCYALSYIKLQNINASYGLENSSLLSKESLLYLITNNNASTVITLTLSAFAYEKLSKDEDIIDALNKNGRIRIAKAS